MRHIGELHGGAIGIGAQHDTSELFGTVQRALHRQGRGQFLLGTARRAAEAAGGHLHVLPGDGAAHVIDGEAIADQLLRIDPHAHGGFGREELQLADARDTAQLVVDIARSEITQRGGVSVLASLLVAEGIDQQKTRTGLLYFQALSEHGLWHARFGFLQTVLHIHLGQLRVRARLEGDDNLGDTVGVVGGLEIEEVLGAVDRLLDHAGDRIHQHLGRRTRVSCGDRDLRRRHAGVLRHRQLRDDQQAGQGNEQRHHPSEVGASDEELRHWENPRARPDLTDATPVAPVLEALRPWYRVVSRPGRSQSLGRRPLALR
ncbi:hypothetical protein FQZ97_432790 [compost metagenome]